MKSVKEIAEFFKIEIHTVFRWIKQGKIKAIKIGKLWKITEEEFEYIKNNGLRK